MHAAAMESLRQRFGEAVAFVKVYVSEAHPTDEWAVYSRQDIDYCQPRTLAERLSAARGLLVEQGDRWTQMFGATSPLCARRWAEP